MASSATTLHTQGMKRQDVEAALAKAMELRALHAALLQGGGGNSPAVLRLMSGASPSLSGNSNQFTAEDYPVFTPSYEEEPLPGYRFIHSASRNVSENWTGLGLVGEGKENGAVIQDNETVKLFSLDSEHNYCSVNDHFSRINSYNTDQASLIKTVVASKPLMSIRRSNSEDFKAVTTSSKCNPATISRETHCDHMNLKSVSRPVQLTNSQPPSQLHPKNRGLIFSWIFPKFKKKPKSEMSPNTLESEDISQFMNDWGIFSLESLKKELLEANEKRDAALSEASEMRYSLEEQRQKLMNLDSYCEELKKALKQAVQGREAQASDMPNSSKRTKSINNSRECPMPVSHEVMVEGFMQIVSETRLSVKQFCKILINQIEETDYDLIEKLNSFLHPHQMNLKAKHYKGFTYHLEALINQCLYQDFENCIFQKNGAPKFLNPQQDRQDNFSAFVALRNLRWNEVLRKGTKCYSEEFSRFCDQRMSCIISILNWSRPWPEQLLQSFFVSAKCIWLLHLLAFSFSPPLVILRVEENRSFDSVYMEDILLDRQRSQTLARVKIMVMPGFYVQDKVLRCKVICRYHSVT